jgi:hypothetical protein
LSVKLLGSICIQAALDHRTNDHSILKLSFDLIFDFTLYFYFFH